MVKSGVVCARFGGQDSNDPISDLMVVGWAASIHENLNPAAALLRGKVGCLSDHAGNVKISVVLTTS